jgi:hypothetical protein
MVAVAPAQERIVLDGAAVLLLELTAAGADDDYSVVKWDANVVLVSLEPCQSSYYDYGLPTTRRRWRLSCIDSKSRKKCYSF